MGLCRRRHKYLRLVVLVTISAAFLVFSFGTSPYMDRDSGDRVPKTEHGAPVREHGVPRRDGGRAVLQEYTQSTPVHSKPSPSSNPYNLTNCEVARYFAVLGIKVTGLSMNDCKNSTARRPIHLTLNDLVNNNHVNVGNARMVLRELELKRQELYMDKLRRNGQLVELPGGGERMISNNNNKVKIPFNLKMKSVDEWSGSERVWKNLTYYPWSEHPVCKNLAIRFAPPGTLRLVALASAPSSGNTWLRYLIQELSGYFTGSVYNDFSISRRGLYGESVPVDSGMTIIQKSHGYTTHDGVYEVKPLQPEFNHIRELNKTAILLLRNPLDVIVSHRHLDAAGHTGHANSAQFVGDSWNKFVLIKSALWRYFYSDWLDQTDPRDVIVVYYEHLKNDLPRQLHRIASFLGISPVDQDRLQCLLRYPSRTFKRRSKQKFDAFTVDQKRAVYDAMACLNVKLIERGQPQLPLDLFSGVDQVEFNKVKCSGENRNNTIELMSSIFDHTNTS